VFAVADGLGGHALGEVASRIAVETFITAWRSFDRADPVKAMRQSMRMANAAVLEEAAAPGRHGMGTTMTALSLHGDQAVIGHAGDSRAYHLTATSCVQLTADHSRVAEMLRMRLISPAQAVHHPARSQLTRSLGADPLLQIDITRHRYQVGDGFVLCSDGMWDEVGGQDMSEMWAGQADDDDAGRRLATTLVSTAIERGSADNVSAVVVIIRKDGPPPQRHAQGLFRRGRS
jgi:protein phosphatase